jgi:putative aldouronate transport system permease protein
MNGSVKANTLQRPVYRSRLWKNVWQHRFLYMMLLLPLAYYAIFCYWPMYGLQIAFKKYNIRQGIAGSDWVGLKYFAQYLTEPYFWKVVRNTFLINIYSLIFSFPAPILLALLLNEIKFSVYKKAVQSISYLPHFLSTVVVCGMVVNFLANGGPINDVLESMGGSRVQFLMEPEYFRSIYIISGIWQNIGWSSIIYFAAISGIDPQLYEAALMDGAGRFKQVWHVTIPAIMPTVTIMLILAIGNLLTIGYEKIILLYNGATYETADVISSYVYRKGILGADYSYSTAVGVFQSLIGLGFIWGANKFSAHVSENSLW